MLLFVEFEGVLRRPRREPPDALDGQLIANFEAVLRRFSRVQLILASDWRLRLPHGQIMEWFHRDVRARFATRLALEERPRGELVRLHLERLERAVPWAALDSDASVWPAAEPGLFLCDPQQGLDEEAADRLTRHLVDRALAARADRRLGRDGSASRD
jgi:hypothetical protein